MPTCSSMPTSAAASSPRGVRHRARARHAFRRRGLLEHRRRGAQQRRRAEPQDRLRGDRLQPERDPARDPWSTTSRSPTTRSTSAGPSTRSAARSRANIARLTRTGALTDFDPNLSDLRGAVLALATTNSTLYVGGSFQEMGGRPRMGYAQFTAEPGAGRVPTRSTTAHPTSAVQPLDGVQDRALFAVEWAGEDDACRRARLQRLRRPRTAGRSRPG